MNARTAVLDVGIIGKTITHCEEQRLAAWQERRAMEIMRTRLGTDLRVSTMASECQLSPGRFVRMFRTSAGMSPHEYLANLRIDESKRLMTNTGLPLADIAMIAGFPNEGQFSRIFSRRVGIGPDEWRGRQSNGSLVEAVGSFSRETKACRGEAAES
ncbi:helix-turn-helix domain-containing protein [Bradyrhizobium ganzhouense]|uniref:helix-turn-helix domain-containing protein n=1 Tax=Bradyrhizobium ganzhouense TaxID=1179767 RepID=UPI003CF26D16